MLPLSSITDLNIKHSLACFLLLLCLVPPVLLSAFFAFSHSFLWTSGNGLCRFQCFGHEVTFTSPNLCGLDS